MQEQVSLQKQSPFYLPDNPFYGRKLLQNFLVAVLPMNLINF